MMTGPELLLTIIFWFALTLVFAAVETAFEKHEAKKRAARAAMDKRIRDNRNGIMEVLFDGK